MLTPTQTQTSTMTSKERVLVTLAGGVPDRVPIDYAANPGIHRRLADHFGTKNVREALGVDFRGVNPSYGGPRLHSEVPDRRIDPQFGSRTRWVEHPSGGYWDYCDFPLKGAELESIENWPMPDPDDYEYDKFREGCELNRSYAVYIGHAGLGDIINSNGFLCGMEDVLVRLAENDPALLRLIDRKLDIQLEVTRRALEVAKGGVDFLWMGEDLGSQNGPLISKAMYREILRPRHKKVVDLAAAFDLPVMIHSCGSSSWAYPDFIELGIKAVDTLQPEAKNMQPERLKREFGEHLAFHGCISTAGPVAHGTVEETVADATKILDIMMPGGGYCFAPTHQLQDNSPTENVLAMYETARLVGQY